jgi:hypothetical protein
MSKGSDELIESMARFARTVTRAAAREAPYVRRAAGRIARDDVPAFQRAAERTARRLLRDLRKLVG